MQNQTNQRAGGKPVKRRLKQILTREDKESKSAQMIQDMRELDQLTEELDEIKVDYKKRLAKLDCEVAEARKALEDGFIMEDIQCDVVLDFEANTKRIYRQDTGEMVSEERLTDEDRQMAMAIEANTIPSEPAGVTELYLWDAGGDKGVLSIGRSHGKWAFGADLKIGERHIWKDPAVSGPWFKDRFDCVKSGGKWVLKWIKALVEPEAVEGFRALVDAAVKSQEGIAE